MAANPAILRLLREADQTKLVKTVDDVMKHLVEDDLVYKCRIPSDLVGVHPSNRDGYGVSEEAVHSLGGDIVLLGFSMSATASAVCIEDGDGKVAEFTKKICNGSEKLASVQPSEIKYGSLSCSHTNQFLRAANAEVPSTNEVLQVGGRINVAKITQNDSELKCALKEGLVWTVLKASVATLYPAFPTMLQAAKNAVGQIQQHETEVQLLMRIQALASAQGGHVDWDRVSVTVKKSRPRCADDVEALINFVAVCGGGATGVYIQELHAFHQAHVAPNRIMGGQIFNALSKLHLAHDERAPIFAIAVLKAHATGPKVQGGLCRFISSSDVASLQKNRKAAMLQSEEILQKMRKIMDGGGLTTKEVVKFLGRFDTVMARVVLAKGVSIAGLDTPAAVGDYFVREYRKLVNNATVPNPWEGTFQAPTVKSRVPAGAALPNFNQFEDGKVVGGAELTMNAAGFNVQTRVVSKDGVDGTIMSVQADGGVEIKTATGLIKVTFDDVMKNYTKKAALTVVEGWDFLHNSSEFKASIAKSALMLGIASVDNDIPTARLLIITKPNKSVVSEVNWKKKKLVIIPYTTKFSTKGDTHLYGNVEGFEEKLNLIADSHDKGAFLSPAFSFKTSSELGECNMEVTHVKVIVSMQCGACGAVKAAKKVDYKVWVPIIQNNKDVAAGEDLIVFANVAKKTQSAGKREMPTIATKQAKRMKS